MTSRPFSIKAGLTPTLRMACVLALFVTQWVGVQSHVFSHIGVGPNPVALVLAENAPVTVQTDQGASSLLPDEFSSQAGSERLQPENCLLCTVGSLLYSVQAARPDHTLSVQVLPLAYVPVGATILQGCYRRTPARAPPIDSLILRPSDVAMLCR
ncbi:MAG: hypothetical protein K1Y36_14355 [Blastocatellia bacterium]|nr:hypothetical protein [Blastocatellia bacterium]